MLDSVQLVASLLLLVLTEALYLIHFFLMLFVSAIARGVGKVKWL